MTGGCSGQSTSRDASPWRDPIVKPKTISWDGENPTNQLSTEEHDGLQQLFLQPALIRNQTTINELLEKPNRPENSGQKVIARWVLDETTRTKDKHVYLNFDDFYLLLGSPDDNLGSIWRSLETILGPFW